MVLSIEIKSKMIKANLFRTKAFKNTVLKSRTKVKFKLRNKKIYSFTESYLTLKSPQKTSKINFLKKDPLSKELN